MIFGASALSAMQAATTKLNATASNIANMNSNGAVPAAGQATGAPAAYQPVRVDQVSGPGGTTAAVVRDVSPSYVQAYDPSASYADAQGQVATPNVDILNELLNLTMAKNDFTLNAKVFQSFNDMVKKLYDILD
jgi:flagellar basal-body rod protein FlgC